MSYRIILKETSYYKRYFIQSNKIFKYIPFFWHYITTDFLERIYFHSIGEAKKWIENKKMKEEKPKTIILKI